MRAKQFLPEAPIGVNKKRPARDGSRPARGHEPQPRYKEVQATEAVEQELDEKASRQLCKSSKPDSELGSSNLASCKSQGLRARDGEKSHLIGHGGSSVRITVGGKKIKGKKYGGPLPDYGTRKGQI
jgi:hypothetical protein